MKNAFIVILLAVVAGMSWWIFRNPPKQDSPIEVAAKKSVKAEVERLNRKKNKNGTETAIMEETRHVVAAAGAKQFADSVSKALYDSLQKVANNRLISYTQARAQIRRLEAVMAETDTSFTYKDKWLTVDVKKPLGSRPPLLTSTYNAELDWVWYRERRHFLAPLRTYGRFSLNDPNARILGVKHIRIEPPQKTFGVDVMAVGEYYRGETLMGAGVSVDAGRFRLQGAYLHDFRTGEWYPAFRGGWKLVGF